MAFGYCVYAYPAWAKVLLGAPIAYSAWTSIWQGALLRTRKAVCAIQPGAGTCTFYLLDGKIIRGRIASFSRVLPFLLVLGMYPTGEKRSRTLIVACDSVTRDEFRRLRIWLRWWPREEPTHNGY